MTKPNCDCWGFIIDTEDYAGSFERDLCAHLTGTIGDCGVGKEYVDAAIQYQFECDILQVADESGCRRPCSIFPTPEVFNNGYGFAYKAGEEDLAISKAKEYLHNDAIRALTAYADIKHGQKLHDEYVAKAGNFKLEPHPAYNSVIIFFAEKPSLKQIELMKSRCQTFEPIHKWSVKPTITGFRLVQFKQTQKFYPVN